ncbi:hypothetical protein CYMTET_28177 [Cymbomonas tetramitiformis]|uniref:Uncharacterized protein n=1 Tax=Cymbomonas tetramitiformis TaxID=36881 RepID=A0AAE0FNV7_9CHLO|nr:hypothetical protein CYMTET_28177 [Cymbomonas tetramitiformis]
MVVLAYAAFGRAWSLLYGFLVAVVAMIIHQSYNPYKSFGLDNLQLAVLINQTVFQLYMLMKFIDEDQLAGLDIVLIVMQGVIGVYMLYILFPICKPVIKKVQSRIILEKKRLVSFFQGLLGGAPSNRTRCRPLEPLDPMLMINIRNNGNSSSLPTWDGEGHARLALSSPPPVSCPSSHAHAPIAYHGPHALTT